MLCFHGKNTVGRQSTLPEDKQLLNAGFVIRKLRYATGSAQNTAGDAGNIHGTVAWLK